VVLATLLGISHSIEDIGKRRSKSEKACGDVWLFQFPWAA